MSTPRLIRNCPVTGTKAASELPVSVNVARIGPSRVHYEVRLAAEVQGRVQRRRLTDGRRLHPLARAPNTVEVKRPRCLYDYDRLDELVVAVSLEATRVPRSAVDGHYTASSGPQSRPTPRTAGDAAPGGGQVHTIGPTPVAQAPDALVQTLPDEESVFLDLVSERYFSLNPTGTAMWSALVETGRLDHAFEQLLRTFDIDAETLTRDLGRLVSTLEERGLLLVGDDALAAPAADPSN